MDFTSIKNNPLWGPARIAVAAFLVYAGKRGWIPPGVIDPDLLTFIVVGIFGTWSIWQFNHGVKQNDLVTALSVQQAVKIQAPEETPLHNAEQKAIIANAKASVNDLTEVEKTQLLNKSQLGDKT